MSRTTVGIVLLLVGSLVLGMLSGQLFFRVFEEVYREQVPAALALRSSVSGAHTDFILRGLLLGFLYFAWALVAVGVARLFRRRGTPEGTVAGSTVRTLDEADRRD